MTSAKINCIINIIHIIKKINSNRDSKVNSKQINSKQSYCKKHFFKVHLQYSNYNVSPPNKIVKKVIVDSKEQIICNSKLLVGVLL